MEDRLLPHAAYPSTAVDDIRVRVERPFATILKLRFAVTGRAAEIIIPAPGSAIRVDNLWRTTCFEAFLRPADTSRYQEFNFAPSSQWAAYEFDAYRAGMRQALLPAAPDIAMEVQADCLVVDIKFSPNLTEMPYRLGVSAVIEERSGRKSYWALKHPGDTPDFHHAACFDLDLPPPGTP